MTKLNKIAQERISELNKKYLSDESVREQLLDIDFLMDEEDNECFEFAKEELGIMFRVYIAKDYYLIIEIHRVELDINTFQSLPLSMTHEWYYAQTQEGLDNLIDKCLDEINQCCDLYTIKQ